MKFPESLVALLAFSDGFDAAGDQDEEGFSFWPLSRFELVSKKDEGAFAYPSCQGHVLFCDYLGFSWAYAIDCRAESSTFGAVFIVGTTAESPPCAAQNFATFMRLYITDDEALYLGD